MVTYKRCIKLFYSMKEKGKLAKKAPEMDADVELRKLGSRIKALRIARGYTSYEQFAYEHSISRAQFGRYEQGKDIRFSSLIKVINALGMTTTEFFSEGYD